VRLADAQLFVQQYLAFAIFTDIRGSENVYITIPETQEVVEYRKYNNHPFLGLLLVCCINFSLPEA
jgi:hypothetical protein